MTVQTWNTLPDEVKSAATSLLTPKQLAAWQLELGGMSQRDIGLALGIARGSVQDRLDGAYRALRAAGCDLDGSGRWTLPKAAAA